jgi:hypothetical protein
MIQRIGKGSLNLATKYEDDAHVRMNHLMLVCGL